MARIHERIPRERFQELFRPVVRSIGSKSVIIRINETARTAIPRQTKLNQLMPKLEILCYEQKRPKVDEAIERLFDDYLEERLGDSENDFYSLTDDLNKNLDGENLPEEQEKVEAIRKTVGEIAELLENCDLAEDEVDLVFRVKAYPDVLKVFLEGKSG
jgi:molecular chaperone DnaK (HSP70)